MVSAVIKRCGIAIAVWLPFFAIWMLVSLSSGRDRFSAVLIASLVMTGSAGLLGIAVWYLAWRFAWPLGFKLSFYLLQILFALVYGVALSALIYGLEFLRGRSALWSLPALGRTVLMGIWCYAVFAGIAYAIQTRKRLHDKEMLAARAEALAAAARVDAIRARLNPHFLFNALHTLAALVKFRPTTAEGAIERLGDMLRYTLKEDGRELVEFSEEYEFTRQYLAFEQLRYEDRLKVDLEIDPEAFHFDIPPFSIQTLAENAVRHAVSVRPEGGAISIKCRCQNGNMAVSVRDNGPGGAVTAGQSHQFGLRSLRERLHAAFGASADLRTEQRPDGFEARFVVPASSESAAVEPQRVGETA